MKRSSKLKKELDSFANLKEKVEELEVHIELLDLNEGDSKEASKLATALEQLLEFEETKVFMGGEYDSSSAIATIHSGAGGRDASDWAKMLFRMYSRWCKEKDYSIEILDMLELEDGGIKHVTFGVEGEYAYGRLRREAGIHRMVRISPFDSNSRRHTSFASLTLSPVVEDAKVDVDPKDLKIDTFKSGGPGGQHVNTTDSAVRITHLPTGVVVSCSSGRSQIKNREQAMKVLTSRLMEIEIEKREEEIRKLKGENKGISWGNQIRSYVFHPYKMVKDHRTKCETSNVQGVMDGDLDQFINESLRLKGV